MSIEQDCTCELRTGAKEKLAIIPFLQNALQLYFYILQSSAEKGTIITGIFIRSYPGTVLC